MVKNKADSPSAPEVVNSSLSGLYKHDQYVEISSGDGMWYASESMAECDKVGPIQHSDVTLYDAA